MSKFKLRDESGNWEEVAKINSPYLKGYPSVEGNNEYAIPQLRNIVISTEDPTDEDGVNGDIWIKYTPAEEE